MLKEFWVDNYKSLVNMTFCPSEQNLLLGANNSGKTNLCQAMTLLSVTAQLPLDRCIQAVVGIPQVIGNHRLKKSTVEFRAVAEVPFESEGQREDLQFEYGLTLSLPNPSRSTHAEVETEVLKVTGPGFSGTVLLENTRQGTRVLHEGGHLAGKPSYAESQAPRDATMLYRLYDLSANPRANCFRRYLWSWRYYALSADALRGMQYAMLPTLLPNGSNLASVIYALKNSDERSYRKLLGHLRTIDPQIDAINFMPLVQDAVVMHFDDAHGNKVPAAYASPGTLKYLALLYIMLVQADAVPGRLLMIEEPENGIYVGRLKSLLEVAQDSPAQPQLIFTTHSPYFIDLFDTSLDGVFVVNRGESHSTITQPGEATVRKRLAEFPLGEQHFREMLG